ncbi:hypothetical protein BGY98DRAFT_1087615 [Russula aff. rugulosa BPL654]|nr:hypothetical protein BGY98DRAFT_1087615 [Russula aff. rugulosa BPL654]
MKYIALLSGGKDSCYNLSHCHKNGHELVAAASLRPEPGTEELDSYLYQTVGQDAIEFVARALEVPLYRRVISGTALVQESEYGGRDARERGGVDGDETEDLYALLAHVKSQHPDVKGVSVGAILSNYQRIRVEHVLSLTPLSYLWQRDQAELLSEMIAAGMEAILIKVAGIGLTTKHLGKTLMEMQPTLTKLNTLYGSHICGEGGEYESLTLDCPLFKQRITLLETETVIHSDNDFATVAFLRIRRASLEAKREQEADIAVAEHIQAELTNDGQSPGRTQSQIYSNRALDIELMAPSISRCLDNWISVGNIHRDLRDVSDMPLEDEVRECFHILQRCLSEHSLSFSHIANMNVFISSMEDFASINAVYATYFGVSPPARACVAVDLPHPLRVMLDCVAYAEQKKDDRKALHVQGLSYWAPANIGPYSQAIIHSVSQTLATEISLVSQHSDRIVKALSSRHDATGGRLVRDSDSDGHAQMILYWVTEERHIPYSIMAAQHLDRDATPTLFLVVKGLPKDALIEKQVLYHTGRRYSDIDEDEEGDTALSFLIYSTESFVKGDTEYATASASVICGRGTSNWETVSQHLEATTHFEGRLMQADLPAIQSLFHSNSPAVTPVPCWGIRTRDQSDWEYALCILSA